MTETKRLPEAAWLFLCVLVAFALRVGPPHRNVFRDGKVVFLEVDPWYHVRLIEEQVRQFPQRLVVDPMASFPGGGRVTVAPLFDLVVSSTAWALGAGNPSQGLVHRVAAYAPAVLGALVPIPVWFIGRRIGGFRGGLLAAALVAVQPGPFLERTLLGFTDHHCLETLLAAATVLAWMGGVCDRGATGVRRWLLPGVTLAAYLLAWSSGALLVAILFAWLFVQTSLDHLRGEQARYDPRAAAVAFSLALVVVLFFQNPWARRGLQVGALALSLAGLGILVALRRMVARHAALPRVVAPIILVTALAAAATLAALAFPELASQAWKNLRRFVPRGQSLTVTEVRPLLYATGGFSLGPAWSWFRGGLLMAPVGLVLLGRRALRGESSGLLLVVVWTVGMTAATLGQNRFAYYLAVNAALLAAVAGASLLDLAKAAGGTPLYRGLAAFALAALAFVPLGRPALAIASHARGPSDDWLETLEWMRATTPEPFADGSRRPSYSVLAWWDHGYWIQQVARRVPVANPTQTGAGKVGRIFTSTEEAEARELLEQLSVRYVIVTPETMAVQGRRPGDVLGHIPVMARWAGRNPQDFYEVWFRPDEHHRLQPLLVYHPAYYRSFGTRLYLYAARPFTPAASSWVLTFEDRLDSTGRPYRQLVASQRFDRYEDAEEEFRIRPGTNRRLVGLDPLRSCVPLAALPELRPVHEAGRWGDTSLPAIRVFERAAVTTAPVGGAH